MVDTRLVNERNYLLKAIDRDRQELRQAIERLRCVTTEQLETLRVGHRVAARPLPFLIGGFIFGLWLGWRRDAEVL
jgi:hypothetical protein